MMNDNKNNNLNSNQEQQQFVLNPIKSLLSLLGAMFIYVFLVCLLANSLMLNFGFEQIPFATLMKLATFVTMIIYVPLWFILSSLSGQITIILSNYLSRHYNLMLQIEKQRKVNIDKQINDFIEENYVKGSDSID